MRNPQPRTGRVCSRAGCRRIAEQTLTYVYADSTAVLGPLATFAEPHAYDLCLEHAERTTLPLGWTVIKQDPISESSGPTDDDLMAIADAVREAGVSRAVEKAPLAPELGRRGHLRALPSN